MDCNYDAKPDNSTVYMKNQLSTGRPQAYIKQKLQTVQARHIVRHCLTYTSMLFPRMPQHTEDVI